MAKWRLIGYPVRWTQVSSALRDSDGQWFVERFCRGAFAGSLGRNLRLCWRHNPDLYLAERRDGTLDVREDSVGLKVIATLPDHPVVKQLEEMVEQGQLGLSVGGYLLRDRWYRGPLGLQREITEFELNEVSLALSPIYGNQRTVTMLQI